MLSASTYLRTVIENCPKADIETDVSMKSIQNQQNYEHQQVHMIYQLQTR